MKTTPKLMACLIYDFDYLKNQLLKYKEIHTEVVNNKDYYLGLKSPCLDYSEENYHDIIQRHVGCILKTLNITLDVVKSVVGNKKYTGHAYILMMCREFNEIIGVVLGYDAYYEPLVDDIDIELSISRDKLIGMAINEELVEASEVDDDLLRDLYKDRLTEQAIQTYRHNHIYTKITDKLHRLEEDVEALIRQEVYNDDLLKFKKAIYNEIFFEDEDVEVNTFMPKTKKITNASNVEEKKIEDFFYHKDNSRLYEVLSSHLNNASAKNVALTLKALGVLGIVNIDKPIKKHLYAYLRSEFNLKGFKDEAVNKYLRTSVVSNSATLKDVEVDVEARMLKFKLNIE